MGKNVAVFVDVANIFYAAKAAGVDIDYVTLLKAASAGRDLVRAYAYTGLDPDNENQRNFHDFLRRSNYKVVSKDIRKYGDGKVKANLDIELVVDMMKTARNLDIAIVVSGDGDFAPAIRAVQEQGVRVEVISFRGNTSSDLIEVADLFTDIVQLARVEKGTRSGRRVADDDADLSMTEVPDKQTEGTGAGRSRGRGRGRGREAEPVTVATRGRSRARPIAAEPAAAARSDGAGLVALPGERLARAGGSLTEADLAQAEVFTLDDLDDVASDAAAAAGVGDGGLDDGAEPRRRRRRGGRGRGRGRGHIEDGGTEENDEAEVVEAAAAPTRAPARRAAPAPVVVESDDDEEIEVVPAPRGPRTNPFGSVWDSQIGTPTTAAAATRPPLVDEEDFEEPEIPEYLIAERRQSGNRGGQGGGRGARGGRAAYQSAMERERYGGRGGSGGVGGGGGGINRYPDVSGRQQASPPPRESRPAGRPLDRSAAAPAPRSSSEPWSDVPPELEALLRAQVAQKPAPSRSTGAPVPAASHDEAAPVTADATAGSETTPVRTRAVRKPAASKAATASAGSSKARPKASARTAAKTSVKTAAKPRAVRKAAPAASEVAGTAVSSGGDGEAAPVAKAAAKPRTPRKSAAAAVTSAGDVPASEAAPKRRTTRKTASTDPA